MRIALVSLLTIGDNNCKVILCEQSESRSHTWLKDRSLFVVISKNRLMAELSSKGARRTGSEQAGAGNGAPRLGGSCLVALKASFLAVMLQCQGNSWVEHVCDR